MAIVSPPPCHSLVQSWFENSSKSETDPVVEPVNLISATPYYERIRHLNGRERTVSTKDLTTAGTEPRLPAETSGNESISAKPQFFPDVAPEPPKLHTPPTKFHSLPPKLHSPPVATQSPDKPEPCRPVVTEPEPMRRCSYTRKPVDRLNYSR